MKRKFFTRAIVGLAFISLGGVALLWNLGIVNNDIWSAYWGVLLGLILITGGLTSFFTTRNWVWNFVILAGGTVIILDTLRVFDGNLWNFFWPVALLIIGVYAIFDFKSFGKKKDTEGGTHRVAFLYGDSLKPQGSYTGGSLTAVMGGIELDLRGADIKDGSVIEVFTLCGDCNIILPDNVTLKNDARHIRWN